MAIIDDIRVKQNFDPTGENGGYTFEKGLENEPERDPIRTIEPIFQSGGVFQPQEYAIRRFGDMSLGDFGDDN